MWLMTNVGFFSIVQKPGTDILTIRTRVKGDLDRLRERYLPELSTTAGVAGTDYPWRATASHAMVASALGKIVMDLHYANFKNEVEAKQGKARAQRYHQVWEVLQDLPEATPARDASILPWSEPILPGTKVAYGGVVFDPEGRVLLREPKNHFDGYVWTFAKGRPDPGETPEQTALREVKEETGAEAEIVAPLPGDYDGGTTLNRYFIMRAETGVGGVGPDDPETASVKWVTVVEAPALLSQTTNSKGRQRDLTVLADAAALYATLQ